MMKSLVVAAVAGATLMSAPAPASAEDHRPCVSKVEFHGAKGYSKAETERRWDVSGLGVLRDVVAFGVAWVYPRCGYSIDEAFYGAVYSNGALVTVVWVKNPDATLHGRP